MKHRRGLLLVILIYVALDLSFPEMPGAFVFDAADSVESIQVARARTTASVLVLPTPAREPFVLSQQARGELRHRLPQRSELACSRCPVVNRLPRATCASPPSSEDPH
jgi:hypothetical protein